MNDKLINFFNNKVQEYNQPSFIPYDPICIPHMFTNKADKEIAGFFAAVFSWGNRQTIIQKSKELMQLMHQAPHDFCLHHTDNDLKKLLSFKHRTFNTTDLLYFIAFFKHHYSKHVSLETAFSQWMQPTDTNIENALNGFYHYFFGFMNDYPTRTQKHIAAPFKKSACKRLAMYLRWMVRSDQNGVDLGLWKNIQPRQLICPIDVHVASVAKRFGLIQRTQMDWEAAKELTGYLLQLDKNDPVKYDFALFGLGVMEKY